MKKIILRIFLWLMSSSTYAALNGISHHSRANCENNESISWDFTGAHWFRVESHHFAPGEKNNPTHIVTTGWQNTWRAAAVHWGESPPGGKWLVIGYHWMENPKTKKEFLAQREVVTDCDKYNGWWESQEKLLMF